MSYLGPYNRVQTKDYYQIFLDNALVLDRNTWCRTFCKKNNSYTNKYKRTMYIIAHLLAIKKSKKIDTAVKINQIS